MNFNDENVAGSFFQDAFFCFATEDLLYSHAHTTTLAKGATTMVQ
jgi:hypothetical protein